MTARQRSCCTVHPLGACNTQQNPGQAQRLTQQRRNSRPSSPSILDLARNRARNKAATPPENTRNKSTGNRLVLLRDVAPGIDSVERLVTCGSCRHFLPNEANPSQGLGACNIDRARGRLPWPSLPRQCSSHSPTRAAVFRAASSACEGLDVDPGQLADWLVEQGDPGWLRPAAVAWWAGRIHRHGWPGEDGS